jgi:hypothetical protein
MMLLSYFVGQKKFPVAYNLRSALFYTVVSASCYSAAMLPPIGSIVLRLSYRTVILFIFIAIILKKDLPLSQIPMITNLIKKRKNNPNNA